MAPLVGGVTIRVPISRQNTINLHRKPRSKLAAWEWGGGRPARTAAMVSAAQAAGGDHERSILKRVAPVSKRRSAMQKGVSDTVTQRLSRRCTVKVRRRRSVRRMSSGAGGRPGAVSEMKRGVCW